MITRFLKSIVNRQQTAARPYPGNGYGGALTQGGFMNPQTGAGYSGLDKSESSFFIPTRYWNRQALQVLYVQSWAAAHFIDIPVDDMFIRWRSFESENESDIERFEDAEREFKLKSVLSRAMKAGRLYGSALLIPVMRDAPLTAPLDVEQVREGDLSHFLVFDRFACSVFERDTNILSPTYGLPLQYHVYPSLGGRGFHVNSERVFRFDGIVSLGDDGFQTYDYDWGVSEIVPVILSILQDQSSATGVAHLVQEASIPVLKSQGFREAVAGTGEFDDPTPEQLSERVNSLKSIYRLMMMDASDDFERVAVNFGGLPDVMDRFAKRLAAAAQIPATRFWGQSPVGMNATGESDMVNYAQHVAAMQNDLLTDPLARLDAIIARSAGLSEAPDYKWLPLTDMSDADLAQLSKTKVEAVMRAVDGGLIDEEEGRRILDGDTVFGELPGEPPEPEPLEPMMTAAPQLEQRLPRR